MEKNERGPDVPHDLSDLYFREIGRIGLLTAEDEQTLARQIAAGNEAQGALDRLSELNSLPESPEVIAERANLLDEARKFLDQHGANTDDVSEKSQDLPADSIIKILENRSAEGKQAFDQFVSANLRLVVSIAGKFAKRSSLDLTELIQEGNLGLIRAVEKFDPDRGYKFSTYATWWIRQAIQRGLPLERKIRLPLHMHDAVVKVRAATTRLEDETGRQPSIDEIAEATNLTPDKVMIARESDHTVTSLDKPVGAGEADTPLGDFAAVAKDDPAAEVATRLYELGILQDAQNYLDDRSWYVLTRRFGLDGSEPATLKVVAASLGLSSETVSKIERKALSQLQERLTAA